MRSGSVSDPHSFSFRKMGSLQNLSYFFLGNKTGFGSTGVAFILGSIKTDIRNIVFFMFQIIGMQAAFDLGIELSCFCRTSSQVSFDKLLLQSGISQNGIRQFLQSL